MTRTAPIVTNLNGGEVDKRLYGRVDLARYPNMLRVCENFLPLAQGPAAFREGFVYVANTRNDAVARLIQFEFSTEQSYVIEASDQRFRFYKDRARIESPPGTPVELITPWLAADLATLKWTQSADTMYLTHRAHAPRKVTRTSHTSWSISQLDWLDGPYLDQNTDSTKTLQPSAASGAITITAVGHAPFTANDVDRVVRLFHAPTWGWAKITGFVSGTQVNATVRSAFGAATATALWRLGAWYGLNYPACCSFHQERLFFAATPSHPQTVWGSDAGGFESFAPSDAAGVVSDDRAVSFTIANNQVNATRWLASVDVLALGTSGGESTLAASSLGEAITPGNVNVTDQTKRKCADLMPIVVDQAVMFVQRAGRKLLEFVADANSVDPRRVAPDLTLLAPHIGRPGFKEIAWQAEPRRIIWAARNDGALVGLTYMRDQQVVSWHRHPLGGSGKALSVACIAGPTQDEVWIVSERVINGATRRFVEVQANEFMPENATDREFAFFVDAGLTYDGKVAQTLALSATGPAGTTGVTATAGGAAFASGDVGREIRYRYLDSASAKYKTARAIITAFTSSSVVSVTLITAWPSATIAANEWRLTATLITGLAHLEGQSVAVVVDGGSHPEKTVSGGQITLDRAGAVVHVGLGYTGVLETLDIEAGAVDGTAQTRRRAIHQVALRLVDTLGALVGRNGGVLDPVEFRAPAMPMDEPPELFSGDKPVIFPHGYGPDARACVKQIQPLPCTVIGLALTMNTGGA